MASDIAPDVQSRWLGAMQMELGVLKSNLHLAEIQLESASHRVAADAVKLEALITRALAAEKAVRELQAQLEPNNARRKRVARGA